MPDREYNIDLLAFSMRLTVYGMLLAVIMAFMFHRLDASAVATIVCFLASVFVFDIMAVPLRFAMRDLRVRSLVMLGCGVFSWWLIYQAEHTRIGWYRFHVLQARVQQLVSKAPAYVITADCDDIITGCSDNIRSLTGYRKDELVGSLTRILMRPEAAERHWRAVEQAVRVLRDNDHSPDAGWSLQGGTVMGLRRKDGSVVPVRVYAGGIRWSEDVQFDGDIDVFAIFVPEPVGSSRPGGSTIPPGTRLEQAPQPPQTPLLSPVPQRESVIDRQGGSPLMSQPGSGGRVSPARPDE